MAETQGTSEWKANIFGCFSDPKLCIFAFCCPCYVVGKNGEFLGEDCLLTGLLMALGVPMTTTMRWRIRQKNNIKGSMMLDGLMVMLLPCCALIQEAKEAGWNLNEEIQKVKDENKGADKNQEMTRE